MKELFDKELLEHYLYKHHIRDMFHDSELPFRLFRYEPGEVINTIHSPAPLLKTLTVNEKYLWAMKQLQERIGAQ